MSSTSACGGACNSNGIADDPEIGGCPALDWFAPPPAGGPFRLSGADGSLDVCQCIANFNRDGAVNSNDISVYLTTWLHAVQGGPISADADCSGSTNSGDISYWLSQWLDSAVVAPPFYG